MESQNTTSDMDIGKLDALKNVEAEKIAAADDSEDEGESIPKVVENYYFTDENQEPVSLSVLPIQMDGDEIKDGSKKQVFLEGTADGGLLKVYKQAIAFKLNLQDQKPVVSVLIKERVWIELQRPRKSYEEMIQRFLITVHFLHFARRNPEASLKACWDHLRKIFSALDVNPVESDLLEHYSLIEDFFHRDQKLKNVEVLKKFVEMKSKKRKPCDEEMDINSKVKKTKFLVSDGDSDDDLGEDGLDESDEEEEDLFDSVCAICDNGGELLCCEGSCMRSFHPNREAGEESSCKSLGLSRAQIKEIQNFYCLNCKYKQHQCFICGKLGSSDKSSQAEVFCCVSATCGRFYHPQCVSKMIAPEAEAEALEKKIAEGLQFTCPVHRCNLCGQTEKKEDEDLQFAICRRCPKAFHRKCLPKNITFEETDDEPQRAWEDLIPNRILIYCRKHKIDPDLGTPRRNHIIFPEVLSTEKVIKKKYVPSESGMGKTIGTKSVKSSELTKGRGPPKLSIKKAKRSLSPLETASPKFHASPDSFKKVDKETQVPSSIRKEDKHSMVEIRKTLGHQESKIKSLELNKSKTVKGLTSAKQDQKKPTVVQPAIIDNEIKTKIMNIVERANTGISLDDVYAKHQAPQSHSAFSGLRNLDKSITQGKVEGSVEAVRTALKKLEEGGSIDDAKAVCGPDILTQMAKWKNKLKVYLAPFLHGMRYTSFGRHFTKIEKLHEVVERLHWYVESGDMIVDFCCGANDFSRLMKAKMEETGKKCFFKNFDIFQPKNDFEFEKRDWFTVQPEELETGTRLVSQPKTTEEKGSRLIMGLNPPFGVKAQLANRFIAKALDFKPKLLILIVPRETRRLDDKRTGYDLIWEDLDLLKGESFYMPGSVDVNDNQLSQWNTVAPPLYLWSRPDFTSKHMAIAKKRGHVKNHTSTAEADVSDARPSKDDANASQLVEGNISPGKNVEKDKQGSPVGNETINKSAVDNREDESKKKDVSLSKTREENKELVYERHVADMKNRVENYDQKGSEAQKMVKDSGMHDEDHDHLALNSEHNSIRRQDRGLRDDDSAHQKYQKEKSLVKEKYGKGKRDKGRQSVDMSEKERPDRERHDKDKKRERPDKSNFEIERINFSPPLKRSDFRRDVEDEYEGHMQEQNPLYMNATDGFGRTFDRGPGNREDHIKGHQIGSNQMGQEIGRGLQGIRHGHVEEVYARGYNNISGVADDGFGRVHRGSSEDYARVQLSHSGSAHEEYLPPEVNRNFPRNFPGLESEYSVSPSDLPMLQNNRAYNRHVQHEYDSERTRLLQENRASDWLKGDSQRNIHYIDQVSHGNNVYARNADLVPEVHRSSMQGQQHEEPSHHRLRGPYLSEAYERSGLTSSAMQRYAPRLDHNMNYSRQPLHQVEQAPESNFFGAGQVRGSQNFSFSPLGFAPGPQNHPSQSSSGWIDE